LIHVTEPEPGYPGSVKVQRSISLVLIGFPTLSGSPNPSRISRRITEMATDNLTRELESFVQDHPNGWSHDEWLELLYHLSQKGHDTRNEDAIGLALERERLVQTLGQLEIRGLGPKRREALATRFGTLWSLMEATPEEIAGVPGLHRTLADQISDVLQ